MDHEAGPWKMVLFYGLTWWSNFHGPNLKTNNLQRLTLGVNQLWTKRNDHAPKNELAIFLKYVPKIIWKKNQDLTILLSSLVFTSLIFLFLLIFTLEFSRHGCIGGEEEDTYFALRIIHVFVQCVKHVVDIQTLILQGKWEKFMSLNLVYEGMGHREENIESK